MAVVCLWQSSTETSLADGSRRPHVRRSSGNDVLYRIDLRFNAFQQNFHILAATLILHHLARQKMISNDNQQMYSNALNIIEY